ncbi:hypothetical protein M758_5G093000 [Ceratodon purpureus]|nr:hypothetical protein M758_5G093000 [Ceratodon purpureus]
MRFCPLCLAPFLRLTETRSVLIRYSLGETAAVPEVETLHDVKNSLFRHCAIKTRQFTRGDCRCGGTTNSMGVKGVAYELALMSLQGLGKLVEGFFHCTGLEWGLLQTEVASGPMFAAVACGGTFTLAIRQRWTNLRGTHLWSHWRTSLEDRAPAQLLMDSGFR